MKKFILSFTLLLCSLFSKAQLFHEDFEVADSVISSGTPGWFSNNRVAAGGIFSDSSYVLQADTSYLEFSFVDTVGYGFYFLSFDHICKIDTNDLAFIEVSLDFGVTWIQIDSTNSQYYGYGKIAYGSNYKFDESSYPTWDASNNSSLPDNTWWKHEIF